MIEFVDLMPTLMDLALGGNASVPQICPTVSTNVSLCTEGQSLTSIMANPQGVAANQRNVAFMQYAACMHDEGVWHDACNNDDEPRVMGYAMRTRRWRYIEWVEFDKTTVPPTPLWNKVRGTELYDHTENDVVDNSAEAVNVVAHPQYQQEVLKLSQQLHAGWRAARERTIP
jgi:iduronate 2-sulfatase